VLRFKEETRVTFSEKGIEKSAILWKATLSREMNSIELVEKFIHEL
jgi:hypothetical protein